MNIFSLGEHNICGISYNKIKYIDLKLFWITFLFTHFQILVRHKNEALKEIAFVVGVGKEGIDFKLKISLST